MLETLIGAALGLASGMRHAMEPDHLAAVSTVVAEQKSARTSMAFAAAWGTGHALMLLGVGGALLVARREMPERVASAFELVVAAMLVALGIRAIVQAKRHAPTHHHEGAAAEEQAKGRARGLSGALRPLAIGVVHGLAGSGALAALAIGKAPSVGAGLLFLAIYGIGAMLGMSALAGAVGVPLARLARQPKVMSGLLALTGMLSIALGIGWAWVRM